MGSALGLFVALFDQIIPDELWNGTGSRSDLIAKSALKARLMRETKNEFKSVGIGKYERRKLYKLFLKTVQHFRNPVVTQSKLLHLMDMENTPFTRRVFKTFDYDESRGVDFREFALTIWTYCTLPDKQLYIFCFDIYDRDKTGTLSREEITRMVEDLYGKPRAELRRARLFRTALASVDRLNSGADGGGGVDVPPAVFARFVRRHAALFFPAYEFQLKLRDRTFGREYWAYQTRRVAHLKARNKIVDFHSARPSMKVIRKDKYKLTDEHDKTPEKDLKDKIVDFLKKARAKMLPARLKRKKEVHTEADVLVIDHDNASSDEESEEESNSWVAKELPRNGRMEISAPQPKRLQSLGMNEPTRLRTTAQMQLQSAAARKGQPLPLFSGKLLDARRAAPRPATAAAAAGGRRRRPETAAVGRPTAKRPPPPPRPATAPAAPVGGAALAAATALISAPSSPRGAAAAALEARPPSPERPGTALLRRALASPQGRAAAVARRPTAANQPQAALLPGRGAGGGLGGEGRGEQTAVGGGGRPLGGGGGGGGGAAAGDASSSPVRSTRGAALKRSKTAVGFALPPLRGRKGQGASPLKRVASAS